MRDEPFSILPTETAVNATRDRFSERSLVFGCFPTHRYRLTVCIENIRAGAPFVFHFHPVTAFANQSITAIRAAVVFTRYNHRAPDDLNSTAITKYCIFNSCHNYLLLQPLRKSCCSGRACVKHYPGTNPSACLTPSNLK